MDIYALLRKDHEHIKALIERVENAGTPSQQHKLLQELRTEFLTHSRAEETVFYETLIERDETFTDFIARSKEEHSHIEHLLNQLLHKQAGEKWGLLLVELKESIESHIDTEEMQVFSVAESNFSDDEAHTLANQMKAQKRYLHPIIEQERNEAA